MPATRTAWPPHVPPAPALNPRWLIERLAAGMTFQQIQNQTGFGLGAIEDAIRDTVRRLPKRAIDAATA